MLDAIASLALTYDDDDLDINNNINIKDDLDIYIEDNINLKTMKSLNIHSLKITSHYPEPKDLGVLLLLRVYAVCSFLLKATKKSYTKFCICIKFIDNWLSTMHG